MKKINNFILNIIERRKKNIWKRYLIKLIISIYSYNNINIIDNIIVLLDLEDTIKNTVIYITIFGICIYVTKKELTTLYNNYTNTLEQYENLNRIKKLEQYKNLDEIKENNTTETILNEYDKIFNDFVTSNIIRISMASVCFLWNNVLAHMSILIVNDMKNNIPNSKIFKENYNFHEWREEANQ